MFNKSKDSSVVTLVVVTCAGNCKCWYADPNLLVLLFQPYIVYSIYFITYFVVLVYVISVMMKEYTYYSMEKSPSWEANQ